jgi:putative peptide zinc metalloprotease protein
MPVWVGAHEFAHAIACRAAGCPVSGAGLELRRFSLPSFFVDTRALYLLPGRAPKVAVALAGPFVDTLFAAGLLSVLAWGRPGELARPALQLAAFCILFGLFFNLSPFRRSDGSNALASALGDPFVPMRALTRSPVGYSTRFAIRAYRAGAVAFGVVALCLMVLLGQMTYLAIKPRIDAYAAQAGQS